MTAHLDPRLAALTPEGLRRLVTARGGAVAREWDYTYPAEEGGDGVRGHLVLYLADASGTEIGNVGFARTADLDSPTGGPRYILADFYDEGRPVRGVDSLPVQGHLRAFLAFMAVLLPVPSLP